MADLWYIICRKKKRFQLRQYVWIVRRCEKKLHRLNIWAPTSGWDRPSKQRCWQFLDITSRSFSAVIKERDDDLARTVSWRSSTLRAHFFPLNTSATPISPFFKNDSGRWLNSVVQVALFYLVLRGLDTIEDDMTIPDEVKQPILRSFHIHTVTPGWTYNGCGPNEDDRQLLVEYDRVIDEVNLLLPKCVSLTAYF